MPAGGPDVFIKEKCFVKPILKFLLLAAGFLSLALGVLGIFLPLLPATPFFLLSALCFSRSSEKLYRWIVCHKWFGKHIHHYLKHRAITRSAKIGAMILLAGSLTLTMIVIGKLPVTIVLSVVGIAVSIHILALNTFDPKVHRKEDPSDTCPD